MMCPPGSGAGAGCRAVRRIVTALLGILALATGCHHEPPIDVTHAGMARHAEALTTTWTSAEPLWIIKEQQPSHPMLYPSSDRGVATIRPEEFRGHPVRTNLSPSSHVIAVLPAGERLRILRLRRIPSATVGDWDRVTVCTLDANGAPLRQYDGTALFHGRGPGPYAAQALAPRMNCLTSAPEA